jgi:membrane-associated phospholipid phosphatase
MKTGIQQERTASSLFDWGKSYFLRKLSELRLEEVIAYFFFIPGLAITMRANFFFYLEGYGLGRKIHGGIWRIVIVAILLPLIPYLSNRSHLSRPFQVLRNALPFLIAIAIYTNLHDTIHFVNPHDVQDWFVRADQWLFGLQPTIWAQQFYRPWLTEILSFCYAVYLPMTILIPLILYIQKKDKDARTTLIGIVLCFYCGYFLYIAFPTVPPRLWLANQYAHDLEGWYLNETQRAMVSITESSSRAAFPSLHAAITLLTLIYSYRFVRKLFWVLLPIAIGLLTATIYLRHHYVVDLIAGIFLALIVYKFSPSWDAAWERFRSRIGERFKHQSVPETQKA